MCMLFRHVPKPTKVALEKGTPTLIENIMIPQVVLELHAYHYASMLLFHRRFAKSEKVEHEQWILEHLINVQVNIPLLDAIKKVPRYVKFLKKLYITKYKLKGNEGFSLGENVSTI